MPMTLKQNARVFRLRNIVLRNQMRIIHDLTEWRQFRNQIPAAQSLGFVPTMGALHKGHLSLMERSKAENSLTIVSIFVNPTQFNRPDDLTHYPRPMDADLALLKKTGVDICILPDADAIYNDNYRYQLIENTLSQSMEGKHRPGHFTGVLTVVMKLLNLVKPTRVYFGEKDYQQFQLIHDMADAFFMEVDVRACPTIREPSGLACSSRNLRLTPKQRELADQFAKLFHQPLPLNEILTQLKALEIDVDYLEEHNGRRFAAVHIGDVRLIDNYASL